MSGNNMGNSFLPDSSSDEDPSELVSQDDQLDQDIGAYLENMENRQRHGPEWWGTRHQCPEVGDPDREFIFARNLPISGEEVEDAVAAYNKVAKTKDHNLDVSMRPSTPPMERAKKEVEGLVEQGFEVTEELRDEIYQKLTRDSGLIAALQEYCRNGEDVPNAHANELLKMVDRLKALFAEEMAKLNGQLQDLSDNFDDYKKAKEERVEILEEKLSESGKQLVEAKDKLEAKQSELDKIQQQGSVDKKDDSTKQSNELNEKADGLSESDVKVARLLKEKAVLQSKIVMYEAGKTHGFNVLDEHEADLIAADDRANQAELARQAVNHFHQDFYQVMREKLSSWKDRTTTAEDDSNQYGSKVSSDTVKLYQEVTHDWDEMIIKFQHDWPPARNAFNGGQIQEDKILKDALEESEKDLKERYDEIQQQILKTNKHEAMLIEEVAALNVKVEESDKKIEFLQDQLDEVEKLKKEIEAKQNPTAPPAPSPPEDLRKLKEDLSHHKDWLVEKDDAVCDLRKANEKLTDQLEKLKEENEELKKQHKEKQDEIRKLGAERSGILDHNSNLMEQRRNLEADVKRVRGEQEELEELRKENLKKLEGLEKEKKQLEAERSANQADIEKLQSDKDKLEKLRQDDAKTLKERIEAEQEKTESDAKQLDDLREEKAQLEAQHATDQADLEKVRVNIKGLTRERDELQQSLDSKTQEIKGLQRENRQLEVDYKEKRRQLERNIANLQRTHDADEEELEVLRRQGLSNFPSADALIRAAGAYRRNGRPSDDSDPPMGGGEMSLMDRINYLNLSVFLRTRNYVELALREGCNRLANMLIHDANKWAIQCREDLSKMNPSVNNQIRASMYVLNGLKRVMVAKDMDEINKGAREFKFGKKLLAKENADRATFGQLIDLAGSLAEWLDRLNIDHANPEKLRGLQADKVSWRKNFEFVVMRRAKKLRSGVGNDPNLKANALRRTGLHSPLTPERWDQDLGLEVPIGDDEVVARRRPLDE
ncbi:hypothetical protein CEP54_001580 [Fusarium duplospermum]|uniref:Uncharacterized protein n=1 Tax=Fusarium duplospermum TaxID=1325734 RepID=A0A428QZM7_9HYPO|nr:hypothetical protein CEP54_001580 [Fusarium duplospermum]